MPTLIRAAATLVATLAALAGLAACAMAGPGSEPAPAATSQTAGTTTETLTAASEAPEPSKSPAVDGPPCGAGGIGPDEGISSYVINVLGVPVVDTWMGLGGKIPIICIKVAHDDGSIQRAIDEEFGEGQAYVVSQFASNDYKVTTRARLTVIDDGERPPQLCVAVQESLPPQCEGVDLVGWDWADADVPFEEQSGVRWGEYFVTGTYSFDTDALTVESATAGGDDVGFAWDRPTGECPDGSERISEEYRPIYDQAATQIVSEAHGVQSYWAASDGCGALTIGVAFDDGRIQQLFEQDTGEGHVLVVPFLRETE